MKSLPQALFSLPQVQGLPFLLIGGHAVIAHGFVRATYDWDFLIPASDRKSWTKSILSLGYQAYSEVSSFTQFSPPADLPPIDLMIVDDATFSKLLKTCEFIQLESMTLAIPSAVHMIALKLHAAKQRSDQSATRKDLDDVLQILRIKGLSVEAPEIKTVIDTYGGPDAYSALKRSIAGGF